MARDSCTSFGVEGSWPSLFQPSVDNCGLCDAPLEPLINHPGEQTNSVCCHATERYINDHFSVSWLFPLETEVSHFRDSICRSFLFYLIKSNFNFAGYAALSRPRPNIGRGSRTQCISYNRTECLQKCGCESKGVPKHTYVQVCTQQKNCRFSCLAKNRKSDDFSR